MMHILSEIVEEVRPHLIFLLDKGRSTSMNYKLQGKLVAEVWDPEQRYSSMLVVAEQRHQWTILNMAATRDHALITLRKGEVTVTGCYLRP